MAAGPPLAMPKFTTAMSPPPPGPNTLIWAVTRAEGRAGWLGAYWLGGLLGAGFGWGPHWLGSWLARELAWA